VADSENSTSLPLVTRRTLLATGASALALLRPPCGAPKWTMKDDPILSLWRDWNCARAEAAAWSRRVGSLEHALARKVGYPRVLIPSGPRQAWATSHPDIDAELEGLAVTEERRHRLHADLAAQQARWDAALAATGFNAAEQNEAEAWRECDELANAIFAVRAQGLIGVIIKLTLILRTGEAEATPEEHPWPQIRSAYDDLRSLVRVGDRSSQQVRLADEP